MLFSILRKIIGVFMHLFFRLKVEGKDNFPKDGAVIVAMNHRSLWDGPLVAVCLPRQLAIMAKKELFDIPVLKTILKWSGVFPVARGKNDLGAIKTALAVLKAQKAFALFPEGRRVLDGEEHVAKAGVAMLAAKTGAPIVPVALSGKYRFLSKVTVNIGKPMYIKSKTGEKLTGDELQEISDYLLELILHMAGYAEMPEKKEASTWIFE